MAQSISINIDTPAADTPVGPVVFVAGTLSIVGTGPPFVYAIDQVNVQIGNGPVTPARISGPLNPSTFPRSFSCAAPLPPNAPSGQTLPISVTVTGKKREA